MFIKRFCVSWDCMSGSLGNLTPIYSSYPTPNPVLTSSRVNRACRVLLPPLFNRQQSGAGWGSAWHLFANQRMVHWMNVYLLPIIPSCNCCLCPLIGNAYNLVTIQAPQGLVRGSITVWLQIQQHSVDASCTEEPEILHYVAGRTATAHNILCS